MDDKEERGYIHPSSTHGRLPAAITIVLEPGKSLAAPHTVGRLLTARYELRGFPHVQLKKINNRYASTYMYMPYSMRI